MMRRTSLSVCFLLLCPFLFGQQFDLVIEGARAMDPETRLDAVRYIGIRDGKIVRISSEPLQGKRTLHAAGLVAAPGFIDLHQHGQDLVSQRLKAFDGVTTALEMEIGVPDVAEFLNLKAGHSLIDYGTTASHVAARARVFGSPLPPLVIEPKEGIPDILPKSGPATNDAASADQISKIEQRCATRSMQGRSVLAWGFNTRRALRD